MDYLERVCKINLRKLSLLMRQMRFYAKKAGLKPSFCYYKRWGVKKKNGHKLTIPLRFSKSGAAKIERGYATHFVDTRRVSQLREARQTEDSSKEGGGSIS